MDARITKQCLGNLLSYDWLKIIVSIAIAALALSLFFTMVRTTPTSAQSFEIYGYTDVYTGSKFGGVSEELESKNAFSYEILTVTSEYFRDDSYSANTIFGARRAAKEGTVMFVTDVERYDEEGNLKQASTLRSLSGTTLTTETSLGGYYDTRYFMDSARAYLEGYFGVGFGADSPLDEQKAEESFLKRNSNDKRFRSQKNRQKGIAQEKERLRKLKADYLTVSAAFGRGALKHLVYTHEDKEYSPGIGLDGLNTVTNLVYYKEGDEAAKDHLALMLFYTSYGKQSELTYDTLSFLSYLVTTYA